MSTAAVHKIVIERWRPERLNIKLRRNRYAAARTKKKNDDLVGYTAMSQGVPKATSKRRVSVHVVLTGKQKPTDYDAIWKDLLDHLVVAGLLIDDRDRWCESGTLTHSRGEVERTEITLEDLEG